MRKRSRVLAHRMTRSVCTVCNVFWWDVKPYSTNQQINFLPTLSSTLQLDVHKTKQLYFQLVAVCVCMSLISGTWISRCSCGNWESAAVYNKYSAANFDIIKMYYDRGRHITGCYVCNSFNTISRFYCTYTTVHSSAYFEIGQGHREFPFRRRKIPPPPDKEKIPFGKVLHSAHSSAQISDMVLEAITTIGHFA